MSENILLAGGWRLWEQFSLRGPGFPAGGVLDLAPEGLGALADKFGAGEALAGEVWEDFEGVFGSAAVDTALRLQGIARSSGFRRAVAWQNRPVLDSGVKPFLSWTPSVGGRTSMPRQREELVAHYWQRFCVKNDTIGFFGPVGWGRWDLSVDGVAVDPGSGLVEASEVYFSSWSVDVLARVIGADPGVREWVAPRRVPFVGVSGGTASGGAMSGGVVSMPGRPPVEVTAFHAELLRRCDGTRAVQELVDSFGGRYTTAEVDAGLEELESRRWIVRRLEVPSSAHPEQHLRAALERIGNPEVRTRALDQLHVLEQARNRVRDAGDDPDALPDAMTALEQDFAALTETAAVRDKNSRTAPCRSLVYGDSRRTATVRVGSALLDELTPLALCLTAARWMTNRFAESVGARIREVYEQLRETRERVDLASLWFGCLPAPHPAAGAEIDRIQAELRSRWAEIIDAPPGARRVRLTSADIADRVRDAFEEPGAGWGLARYISPDIAIVATDAAAVERGDFELVLGELHVAMNTIGASLFVMQHPDADELLAETSTDFPGPRLLPMLHKEKPPRWSARSRMALIRPEDHYVGLVDYTADPRRPHVTLSADAVVEDRGGRLSVVLPDGAVFDVLDVFGNALTQRVMDRFTLRPEGVHAPRVTVDRMVVSREAWRFTGDEVEFAAEKNEARRFVRARRWREEHGMPRFVFVVSPTEPRPFYLDFDSPVYVNIFAKAVRRLARKDPQARLTVTEMMPDPEQVWLTDHEGAAYTSELRFVAVDQTGPDGAGA